MITKTLPIVRQHEAVIDIAALAANRRDADPYESKLLAEVHELTAKLVAGLTLHPRERERLHDLARRLQALDRWENADHHELHRTAVGISWLLERARVALTRLIQKRRAA